MRYPGKWRLGASRRFAPAATAAASVPPLAGHWVAATRRAKPVFLSRECPARCTISCNIVSPMHEIAPGIRHWTAPHPRIKMEVSSYWLEAPSVLLDPLDVPDDIRDVREIVLSNRHHKRGAFEAAERFGAPVHA